jgi:hypothetical protein
LGVTAVLAAAGLALAAEAAPVTRTVDRLQTEARGFYLLWAQGRPEAEAILELPYVRGGQVVLQWAEVAPAPGRYDFSEVDAGLARFAVRRQRTTLQINGNQKPAWLFAQVPHVAERLSVQVRDAAGTLMFWHPRFQQAHLAMLEALAAHLRQSPHRGALLGLRLNFNAIGTEHFTLPEELRRGKGWIAPPGGEGGATEAFTEAAKEAYENRVVEAYDRLFADWTTVFVRNNVGGDVRDRHLEKFNQGRLAWFHTSSEAEPRSVGTERQYATFVDYCRSGRTVAYAEPWASAWGEHGGGPDPRWCSPAQWNYWTLLLNLHCGVSFIGEYFTNLHYAVSGRHGRDAPVSPEAAGPREFRAAYEWGAEYVGRHNRPAESPGAWVAFRDNAVVKAENPRTAAAGRKLGRFSGDYTWLAERVGDDGSVGVGPVGPAEQRFGAFARRYPAGTVARVRLDPDFVRSLTGDAAVRVVALGEGREAAGRIRAGQAQGELRVSPDRWTEWELRTPAEALRKGGAVIDVQALSGNLLLHLVEVRRMAPSASR